MATAIGPQRTASVHATVSGHTSNVTLVLSGQLDMNTTGLLWQEVFDALKETQPKHVIIDASDVTYCDGAGIALIAKLRQHQKVIRGDLAIHGLQQEFRRLLDYDKGDEHNAADHRFVLVHDAAASMNVIWHNQYREEVEVREQSPEALVSGWNDALRSILNALEADMRQALQPRRELSSAMDPHVRVNTGRSSPLGPSGR
jgi:anti-anti-sigma factor